ncbi:MAG: SUMF1/EgtB/PvdO family nonheme iron enzyme [Lewinellaceae bacterium]|nr:SUMF1/EgtB/PvdO family nonheme iron enzyme [Saprospiraceae bacterium]MCB9332318.1 SUMF1/EgtB/PvdO family nonheme iron enzyme [Lewinellaceae bacterium]
MLLIFWLSIFSPGIFTQAVPEYPELVFIEGGSFSLGDSLGDADEKPVHNVRVSNFYFGKTEVTLAQFQEFIQTSGYQTDAERGEGSYCWGPLGWNQKSGVCWRHDEKGDLRPVTAAAFPVLHVSWQDAAQYCNWLSLQQNLALAYRFQGDSVLIDPAAAGYRLPTEAEWEYAAKAGGTFPYAGSARLHAVGWYAGNAQKGAHPVGQKAANAFGVFDCSGNVWEWCQDWYDATAYAAATDTLNPRGPHAGSARVVRGGSWSNNPAHCRASNRSSRFPDARDCNLGFRVARNGK